MKPAQFFRAMGGEDELYMEYSQEPGRAVWWEPWGKNLRDRLMHPKTLPSWLSEDDLEFFVAEFERTGFTGALNRYRNLARDWEDLAEFENRPIEIPALFIGGSRDGPTQWEAAAIEHFPSTLPRLHRSVILDGCGHWIQQERPAETNALLVEFLNAIRGS